VKLGEKMSRDGGGEQPLKRVEGGRRKRTV